MDKKITLIAIVLAVIAIFFSIYAFTTRETLDEANSKEHNLVLEYEFSGGLCPTDLCGGHYKFYSDEVIIDARGDEEKIVKDYDFEKVEKLLDTVTTDELERVKETRFEDTCPTAYDGIKVILTFYRADIIYSLDSCVNDFNAFDDLSRQLIYSIFTDLGQ